MLLTDARLACLDTPTGYGLIEDGALWLQDGRIAYAGSRAGLPEAARKVPEERLEGRLVTPGLIDCHTHLVHAGSRADEFEARLQGTSYAEIAQAGGGIRATVTATRDASEEALVASALPRLDALLAEGVTTVEVKSGYGLEVEAELRMLRAARRLAAARDVELRLTYLAAHAVPPEYEGRADAYIDEVVLPGMEAAAEAGLVDAVDGFCEHIAFDAAQVARVFERARALNLPVKLHAEQLSHMGGAALAARYGALSADHLEYARPEDARAMAQAGTTAVLLPGAFYTLRETQLPPVAAFREAGVPMALASDCNPGSSPLTSLLLTMNMGCTLFGMTPEEALRGVTCHAARALGLADRGALCQGARADLAIWDAEHPRELAWRIGFNPLHRRIIGGRA